MISFHFQEDTEARLAPGDESLGSLIEGTVPLDIQGFGCGRAGIAGLR